MGKALAEDTPIPTTDGFKPMSEIQIGDMVYDEMGNPTKVINKTEKQVNRECYAVNFTHGETIVADAEHNWKVSISGKEHVLTTKELTTSDIAFITIPTPKNGNTYSISTIEKVDSVPVYCIEVDSKTHMFLAGNTLIPTHNCVIGDTKIKVRNKTTGEMKELTIEEFHGIV